MKRATLVAALSALLVFGVASVADAHFLSKKRAQTATLNYQADQCNSNPSYADCYGAAAGPQKRLTLHKVRVLGHIFGIVAGTTQPYDCERIFIWRIKAGKPASKLFGRLKAETCFDDWDGHGTPPVLRKDAGRKASLDVLEDGPRTILSG